MENTAKANSIVCVSADESKGVGMGFRDVRFTVHVSVQLEVSVYKPAIPYCKWEKELPDYGAFLLPMMFMSSSLLCLPGLWFCFVFLLSFFHGQEHKKEQG